MDTTINSSFLRLLLAGCLLAAVETGYGKEPLRAHPHTNDGNARVHLICLDPGHFHAALVQKHPNPSIDPTVRVYAPEGEEVQGYLALIRSFNERSENPTAWREKTYIADDFLARMLRERAGNTVLLAGNNQRKIDYIERSVGAGLNVFADKPLVIDREGFRRLEKICRKASAKGLLVYDMMTERYNLLNRMLRVMVNDSSLFGTLTQGAPDRPAVEVTSIHAFYKEVAGKPLTRPAWYYDVNRQGEGIVDVTTHLIDQINWNCFPDQTIDYRNEIELTHATHYPTRLSLCDYARSTGCPVFPEYLRAQVQDSVLEVNANGTIDYRVKGVNVHIDVQWRFENPAGSGDIARTVIRGTKATLMILQEPEQHYRPTLYIEPAPKLDRSIFEKAVAEIVSTLEGVVPGIRWIQEQGRVRVIVPEGSDPGHEAHFAALFDRFADYLERGIPAWETNALLTKYYITCQAHALAQDKQP